MAVRLVLVGCGNMGHAMLAGWLKAGQVKPAEVAVVEPNEALRQRAAALGAATVAKAEELGQDIRPDLVVLAVKPQVMRDVLPAYRALARQGSAFLSIAAGTRIAVFEQALGNDTPIVRCMPNTPAAIGKGMMVTVANAAVSASTMAFVDGLLAANGAVARLGREDQMDAVTAVSGSGPAYVFHFIECLREAGVAAGLPRETAALLAMQTVYGAAGLARESEDEPGRLREQVTSPNGTTAAALSVLMGDGRLERLVSDAVAAAKKRSIELG